MSKNNLGTDELFRQLVQIWTRTYRGNLKKKHNTFLLLCGEWKRNLRWSQGANFNLWVSYKGLPPTSSRSYRFFLWSITGEAVEPVVHTWPLTCHRGTNKGAACALGALALWCDGFRQWAFREPIPHGTPCHQILCIIYTIAGVGWGEKRNMEKEASRFKTFSDHKELLLNLPWSGEHRDRVFFFKNWIWRKDWRSMGTPQRVAGDHIPCKVIGGSMWFPWFALPL